MVKDTFVMKDSMAYIVFVSSNYFSFYLLHCLKKYISGSLLYYFFCFSRGFCLTNESQYFGIVKYFF
jgi:hypothetical protein